MGSENGCGAELVPMVVVSGVTFPRNASTEPGTLQNMIGRKCLQGLLQTFPGSSADERNTVEVLRLKLVDIKTSCI